MKRVIQTGLIILDRFDIFLISLSSGLGLAYLYKKYKARKNGNDPLVTELREKSPLVIYSEKGKPVKLPLVRGGDLPIPGYPPTEQFYFKDFKIIFERIIKNRKFAEICRAIIFANKKQRQFKLLQFLFMIGNAVLTQSVGLRVSVGVPSYTEIVIISFVSSISGFVIGLTTVYPLETALLPLTILFGRGIEPVYLDNPAEKCRIICKAAAEIHNKEILIEMKKLTPMVKNTTAALDLPVEPEYVACVENKLSIVQRYQLKELIRTGKAKKQVQHYSEFIKQFPECDPDPNIDIVVPEIIKKVVTGKN